MAYTGTDVLVDLFFDGNPDLVEHKDLVITNLQYTDATKSPHQRLKDAGARVRQSIKDIQDKAIAEVKAAKQRNNSEVEFQPAEPQPTTDQGSAGDSGGWGEKEYAEARRREANAMYGL